MRKASLLTLLSLLLFAGAFAQVVPQGMKYQAVARDLAGNVIANQPITLKISLVKNDKSPVVYYSEVHTVTTSSLGLFTLVIGEGQVEKGTFSAVPWSTDEIWMQVSIKDKGSSGFTTISNSKLLAVPYAFHAATASQLVPPASKGTVAVNTSTSSKSDNVSAGSPATPWMTFGNRGTNPPTDHLGTTDNQDLVVITNNLERFRIYANGNFEVKGAATLDSSLLVKGPTTYGGNIEVKGTTTLDSTVLVKGQSTFNKNMEVKGTATLDSSLLVKGNSTYNGNMEVKGTTTLDSSLLVKGQTTLNKNIEVKGTTTLDSTLLVKGIQTITNNTATTNPSTGALVVTGGVGIGGNLNVAGTTSFGSVGVSSYISAKGLNITNDSTGYLATFQNTNTGTGDGIKIKLGRARTVYTLPPLPTFDANTLQQFKDLIRSDYVGDKLTLLGNIIVSDAEETGKMIAGVAVGAGNIIINELNDKLSLPLVLPALTVPSVDFPALSTPDITIHTPDPLPNIDLPGFKITDGFNLLPATQLIGATTVMPKLPQIDLSSIGIPSIDITNLDFWGLNFSFTLSDASGSSPLNNENEFIRFSDKDDNKVGSIRGESVSDWASNYINPIFLFKLRGALLSSKVDKFHAQYHFKNEISTALLSYRKIGVEYSSGNGDYAEWLERLDKKEAINAGDIVAVKGGKITKDLAGAEQVMVVSHNPIMLGNTPAEGKSLQGNNIAFIGQVPVKVIGVVVSGDYIIGHSSTPGYGIAKHPDEMSVEDFKYAVGRSWVTDESEEPKMVNTVVGVHNNNFINIINELKEKEAANDARLKAIEAKLHMTTPVPAEHHRSTSPKIAFKDK